jgi:mutator protein MutT
MKPSQYFHHCPRCGARQPAPPKAGVFTCVQCGFTLYLSAAIATAVFINRGDGHYLFIRRAKDPARGKLSPPGGFVDMGETAEEGVRREVREEVGLEVSDLKFFCSLPNEYYYKEVSYPVLDLFFTAQAVAAETAQALDDVESFRWLTLAEVQLDDIAFPSIRAAFSLLRDGGVIKSG